MIRVLIVDDDRLVRMGLSAVMPWKTFDMEVVGEANNGEAALEFLSNNEVDLLLTDITMPVMSGIELMKIAHKRYPRLLTVILTFHEDFEYIQETMRLGAIDYISKLQMEKENFEEVLDRICKRIRREQQTQGVEAVMAQPDEAFKLGNGFVLVSVDELTSSELHRSNLLSSGGNQRHPSLVEIDGNRWFWTSVQSVEEDAICRSLTGSIMDNLPGWLILSLSGLAGKSRNMVISSLRRYSQIDFFYDYELKNRIVLKAIDQIGCRPPAVTIEEYTQLKKQWMSMQWIYDRLLFDELLGKLKQMQLSEGRIVHLMVDIANEWDISYRLILGGESRLPETFLCWQEVVHWLSHLQEIYRTESRKYPYSREIMNCILEASRIVKEELDQEIHAQDVAKRVNLSRSYFSQAFKEIIGKSFSDFLRHTRVEKAKEYLSKSNKPIQMVAELTGYMDQKYFSQVFKEHAGMLPSEYREHARIKGIMSEN